MGVFRVNKTKNYTVMSNHHFKDKRLTLKAKGLLSQMLSLPDDWDYSVNGLVAINRESKTAIQGALKELEDCGYLTRTRINDDMGRIDYIYDIYETPRTVSPRPENPVTVNPCTANQPQLSIEESNTNESITNNKNTMGQSPAHAEEPKKKAQRFVAPSLEEVRSYCEERHNGIDPQYFIDYYEARGWKYARGVQIKSWKACVRTWERRSAAYDRPKQNSTPSARPAQPHDERPKTIEDYKRDICERYNFSPEQRAMLGM